MRCTLCYYNAKDDAQYCPNCGEFLGKNWNTTDPYAAPDPSDRSDEIKNEYVPKSETANDAKTEENPNMAYDPQPINVDPQPASESDASVRQRPMKWFKFMIYFALFAAAVLNFANAFQYATGMIYGGSAGIVYEVFPKLKLIDMIMGGACFVLAIFNIITRNSLAKFKSSGPKLLTTSYILIIATNVIYYAAATNVIGSNASTISTLITSCLGTVIMLIANGIYFKHRKHMFVN